jgi:hypothetical protein
MPAIWLLSEENLTLFVNLVPHRKSISSSVLYLKVQLESLWRNRGDCFFNGAGIELLTWCSRRKNLLIDMIQLRLKLNHARTLWQGKFNQLE